MAFPRFAPGASTLVQVLLLTALLTGCTSMTAQFRKFTEPPETVERARVRVMANNFVTAIPNSSCIDMSIPESGTIFGGIVGSRGYRGRSLGMPLGMPNADTDGQGEFYVAANEPLTLNFFPTPEVRNACNIALSFVPEKDQDYEAVLFLRRETLGAVPFISFQGGRTMCYASVISLTRPDKPVAFTRAPGCR